jgi:hypothetical protein
VDLRGAETLAKSNAALAVEHALYLKRERILGDLQHQLPTTNPNQIYVRHPRNHRTRATSPERC